MDDAREWTATAPRGPAGAPAAIQPGDPWGAPLWAADLTESPRGEKLDRVVSGAPAGVSRRAVALILDLLLVGILMRVGFWLAAGLGALAPGAPVVGQAFALTWLLVTLPAYFVVGHGTAGRTAGKRLLGLRVLDASGAPIGYVRAAGRFVATVLAILPLGIGLALAGLRADRRGLHDLLAGTRVVQEW
jgi:uncharacterized RDD family membrane protein YckC